MPRSAVPESKSTPTEMTSAHTTDGAEFAGTTGTAGTAGTAGSAALNARYGRTPDNARRTRLISWSTAGAFVVVFGAWLVWGGLLGTPAQLESRDVGHTIVDDRHVDVRFEITTDAGAPVTCAIQALNESFGIVGWKIVELGASEQRNRTFVESVRTSELAVTGLIYRCWLA